MTLRRLADSVYWLVGLFNKDHNMNGYDVQKWKRCEELAQTCGVSFEIYNAFRLIDARGFTLGTLGTVDEVFSFLCGYEHSCKPNDKVEFSERSE